MFVLGLDGDGEEDRGRVNINCPVNVLHFQDFIVKNNNFFLIANSRSSDIALN